MLYMILGRDVPDSSALRARVRPAHLARVQALSEEGRLVLAGPTPAVDSPEPGPAGVSGSLIVGEFDSLDAARAWIAGDPYVTAGVFATTEVHPFVQAFP
jgi:uncharacterized protein YciI